MHNTLFIDSKDGYRTRKTIFYKEAKKKISIKNTPVAGNLKHTSCNGKKR